jgi:superfamily II DNA/RNA helicase
VPNGSGFGSGSGSGWGAPSFVARVPAASLPEVTPTWEATGVSEALLLGLAALGYEAPSSVQARVVPAVRKGLDVIAQSPSGTGKTCAYALPALQGVDVGVRACQVVVMVPTWELVAQVVGTFEGLASALPRGAVRVLGCSGSGDPRAEAAECRRGVHVVVGTPGTLQLLLRWGAISCASVRTVVLDEADDTLGRNKDAVVAVFTHLSASGSGFTGQVVVTSATVDPGMLADCEHFVRPEACVRLLGPADMTMPASLSHFVVDMYHARIEEQLEALPEVVEGVRRACGGAQVLVFANARVRVERALDALRRGGYPQAEAMHSGMRAEDRECVMAGLVSGAVKVVVTTDVLARGVDAQGVGGVVNLDVPHDVATYVHRVGRAGRFGRQGVAVTLCTGYREQREVLGAVEALLPKGAGLREWREWA